MSKFKWFWRYDQFNFPGLDFYIGNKGVIFGDFFTIFAYKISNIVVESTKIATKVHTMYRITKEYWRWIFLKILVKIRPISTKMTFFTKVRFNQNHIFCYILSYSEARVLKFVKSIQNLKYKKALIFFLLFSFLMCLFIFL